MEKEISQLVAGYERGMINRRALIGGLLALVGSAPVARGATFQGMGLNHVALSVTNVERSRDFYQEHFGLRVERESSTSCFLDLGDHFLALFRSAQPGLNHYCIAINGFDAGKAVETLSEKGLESRRSGNRVYFDDPDGIEVQVSAMGHGV